ncbi:MAG: lysoplasmalogenase [Candidatus Hermodarchaeota archaeon]
MIEYIFLVVYFILAVADLFACLKDNKKLEHIVKPLLMPILALYFIFATFTLGTDWLIVVALLFGCTGDIFLMLENEEKYFVFGMVGFLIGHIFYIIAFLLSIGGNLMSFPMWGLLLILPVVIILSLTFPKFKNNMGELKIPVYVYMVAIISMHFCAILRLAAFDLSCPCFLFVWIGSILFIFSDSMIAVDTFNDDIEISHFHIMLTYILGQFLIAQGIIMSILL